MKNLNFSPFPELTTGRFVLREINEADAPLIHELRSDKETNALIGRVNSNGLGDALLHIDRIQGNVQRNESVYWVICFENSPDLIGTIGLWNFDISAESAEIGYELLPAFRGRGIMSEILPRVVQFGFEQMNLKMITASSSDQNTGSIKLLEKCGFRPASLNTDNPWPDDPGMISFVLTVDHWK
jgi:ribosomal-protein-alanine N-acetyltransferase